MKRSIHIKKPLSMLEKEAGHDNGLKRALGPMGLVTLGIGAIIGAGIFVLTGQVAAQYAGPAIVLSFIISGIACAFAGLCYAEFASMIPIAGSAYTYAYATMGEFLAWFIGWDLIIEYLFAASTVAVGWSGYLISLLKDLGIHVPPQFAAAYNTVMVKAPDMDWTPVSDGLTSTLAAKGIAIASLPHVIAICNLPAMLIIFIITLLLIRGISESATFNSIMVVVKVAVILAFIIFGFNFIQSPNWTPFIPPNLGEWGQFGLSGVLQGAAVIFFAYIGFDAVSTAAQEAKNPQRDMPIGIMGSLAVSTVLYILVAFVLTGIVHYTNLNVPDPVAVGVNAMGSSMVWLRPIIKIAALAGLSSVVLVMLMGQPRIFFTMSKDGLLPPVFQKIHPKYKTPYLSSIITCVFAMILAGILPISILGELVSIGTLMAFAIVCIGVIFLRVKQPKLHRPFKTPLFPLIPILGAISCFGLMYNLKFDTWLRLIIWMLIGFVIYFSYSKKNSKLAKYLEANPSNE